MKTAEQPLFEVARGANGEIRVLQRLGGTIRVGTDNGTIYIADNTWTALPIPRILFTAVADLDPNQPNPGSNYIHPVTFFERPAPPKPYTTTKPEGGSKTKRRLDSLQHQVDALRHRVASGPTHTDLNMILRTLNTVVDAVNDLTAEVTEQRDAERALADDLADALDGLLAPDDGQPSDMDLSGNLIYENHVAEAERVLARYREARGR